MPERDQFHLDIFGNILDDEKAVRAQLGTLNLTKHVTLHGFVPEPELESFLSTVTASSPKSARFQKLLPASFEFGPTPYPVSFLKLAGMDHYRRIQWRLFVLTNMR